MRSLKFFLLLIFCCLIHRGKGQTDSAKTALIQKDSILNKNEPLTDTVNRIPFHQITYARPPKWGFIKNIPKDIWQIARSPFRKENLVGLSVVVACSALLIWQDQSISNGTKKFAKNINLSPNTSYNVLVKAGDTKIIKIPRNLNTALYQLGEGGTSMMIAGGMFLYGKIKKDNRALQTASDLAETFISMGISTQLLKRSFGRESPFKASVSGGAWRPFPAFSAYQGNTPKYDAFPSGHLATMMATVTVLTEHYPEKKWIKPVGYSAMALSCFAMINTDVHWAGDYPLALAIGYVAGKITAARHKVKLTRKLNF